MSSIPRLTYDELVSSVKLNSVKMMKHRGYKVSLPEYQLYFEEFPEEEEKVIRDFVDNYRDLNHKTFSSDDVRVCYDPNIAKKKFSLIAPETSTPEGLKEISFLTYLEGLLKPEQKLHPITSLSEIYYHPEKNHFALVYFSEKESLVKAEYQHIQNIAESLHVSYVIVLSEKLSQSTIAKNFEDSGPANHNTTIKIRESITWEYFNFSELIFCIAEHALAPKITRVLETNERRMMEAMGFGPANMTFRLRDDPLYKFYGIGVKEVVEKKSYNNIPNTLIDHQLDYHFIIPPRSSKK
jgi:hypothetical protein